MDNDISALTNKIAALEKENQKLNNQVALLKSELEHKTTILAQTNQELTESQSQYKQLLAKMVELSQKPTTIPQSDIDPQEVQSLQMQLREQQLAISALQDNLLHSKKKNYDLKSSRTFTADSNAYDQIYSLKKQTKKFKQELQLLEEDNQTLASEIHHWVSFSSRLYDILSDSLEKYPDFPIKDYQAQRRIIISLTKSLIKQNSLDIGQKVLLNELKEESQNSASMICDLQNRCAKIYKLIGNCKSSAGCFSKSTYQKVSGEITKLEEIMNSSELNPKKKTIHKKMDLDASSENNNDFFSQFGSKVQKLTNITKTLKNDYVELKKLQKAGYSDLYYSDNL